MQLALLELRWKFCVKFCGKFAAIIMLLAVDRGYPRP
jgi:hypothetical protein